MRKRWLAAGAALAAGVGVLLWRLLPATGDTENLPPARHETRDVGFRPMLIAGVLMLVALGGVAGLAALIYPRSQVGNSIGRPVPDFPAPELQTNVGADMARFRDEQLRQLNAAYWLDREHGVVHLPIETAMQDVARTGIPDWPGAPPR